MAESYFGQTTFGGLDVLGRSITAPPARATASASASLFTDTTFQMVVASANASALVPGLRIVVSVPVASATASMRTGMHGGEFRADLPTTLTLWDPATDLELERATTLDLDRATLLELWRLTHALALYGRATTLVLGEPTSLDLSARSTTLYLDPGDTTLVPDDNVKVLILDG